MRAKIKLESCSCGSESYLYMLTTPVLKEHIKLFEDAGFRVLKQFFKVGVLQAVKKRLTITISFGQIKMNVRCYNDCNNKYKELEEIISKIENGNSQ